MGPDDLDFVNVEYVNWVIDPGYARFGARWRLELGRVSSAANL